MSLIARVLAADPTPPAHLSTLHRELVVAADIDSTFAFFADPSNLERLTPPWLNFTILTPMPAAMRAGVEIDYQIRLYRLPVTWRSRIEVWEPGVRFVDRQLVGPYRWWRHEHVFESTAHGTRVLDQVDYLPRAAWLSGAIVRRDLERIFSYRHAALLEIFQAPGSARQPPDPPKSN